MKSALENDMSQVGQSHKDELLSFMEDLDEMCDRGHRLLGNIPRQEGRALEGPSDTKIEEDINEAKANIRLVRKGLTAAGGISGAFGGAAMGVKIGRHGGAVGAVAGGVIGAILGLIAGGFLGSALAAFLLITIDKVKTVGIDIKSRFGHIAVKTLFAN